MTSRTSPRARRRYRVGALALLATTLVPGLTQLPALAGNSPAAPAPKTGDDVVTLADAVPGLDDLDTRGRVAPAAAVKAAAGALDAVDLRYNQYGTPASILPADGVLATASSSSPVEAARDWLRDNAAAFGLSTAQVDALELVSSQKLAQSPARAVLFRQRFGDLASALDGMVTVGVARGTIAYASSSLVPTDDTVSESDATLEPVEAWVKAAADVGRDVTLAELAKVTESLGWTRFRVPDFAQEQQVRLRALALADGTVRPVYETNVVDIENGATLAYTSMVDAETGEILHRQNQVEHSSDFVPFQGDITGTTCGEPHEFSLSDGNTRQIDIAASAANAANDIVVRLYKGDEPLASGDLLTSPETLTYAPGGTIEQGVYNVRICPFEGTPFLPPTNYAGFVATSDTAGGTPQLPSPRWRFFPANPALNYSPDHTPRNSVVGCWEAGSGCTLSTGPFENPYGGAWDYLHQTGLPTLSTTGNNAQTREAWLSPLTPGGFNQMPISPERRYVDKFTDEWNNNRCDPSNFQPGGNDILAATTNLHVAHNRMHDYSYGLGFTEENYNMQLDNLGRNEDPTRENDPEIGNVQAGAIGGLQSGLGRDNANQITLQDGVPGVTNQYLFQPIAGAFYAPCVDGAMDMSITGHEYTHAITNRMVAGPDAGLTSEHGGAMGESWGDLVAAEYLWSHGYGTGGNPWAVGPYATGNGQTGIRDYAINKNPLNFGNYGFDSTGDEVHADGEIWNGTQWTVRQSLVKRWNFKYAYDRVDLQRRCAEERAHQGPRRAQLCPGNRRWIQLMFDSFLLQQSQTSMLDARDAMIAADVLRFEGGPNRKALWDAFAKRGFGIGASTPDADSGKTKPSFASPTSRNGKVTFRTPAGGKVYVGHYEARSTPVADTLGKSKLDATASFVPGTYRMLFVSKTHGFKRFTMKVEPGAQAVRVTQPRNLAAKASGAKVIGSSADSRNPAFLIDGTEGTNWGGVNEDGANVDEVRPFVAIDLAGGKHTIRRVNVSAMLNPAPASGTEIPFAVDEDPDSGSRFTALRKFALEACVAECGTDSATWKRFYTSKDNAFPAKRPRPVAPTLNLRTFDVPNVEAKAIRLVTLENQCTGFAGYAGDQDDDDTNNTDCKSGSDRGSIVHVSELHVY